MLYPLTFRPVFKERVWGGRNLQRLFRKPLPAGVPVGESWEISDRPGDVSVITNGPLAGRDLRWLMENHERELLGDTPSQKGKFPLLIKILDAQEKLSLQVHPPAAIAGKLGGEPKTEMWLITNAAPDAKLYVGLKRGVTRRQFEKKIEAGTVAECFHRLPVKTGDTMFLPSGRVHALGAGLVLFEVQQNSDTTYRVFDWNRVGLDGKRRELHVPQSLACIDFHDFEPGLVRSRFAKAGHFKIRPLVSHSLFHADIFWVTSPEPIALQQARLRIVGALENQVTICDKNFPVKLRPGEFALIPASMAKPEIRAEAGSRFLMVEPGTEFVSG